MGTTATSVRIQDNLSNKAASVVQTVADPAKNAMVVTNPNGSSLTSSLDGFDIPAYDYISLSYTWSNLTWVVYKTGWSWGTTVGTLTLAYTGSDLVSVTKS